MVRRIEALGSFDDIVREAVRGGIPSEEIARLGLQTIFENPGLLSEDDQVSFEDNSSQMGEGASGFISGDGKYYINIKTSLIIVALLFASTASITVAGISFDGDLGTLLLECFAGVSETVAGIAELGTPFFELNEECGGKCILLEFAKGKAPKSPTEIKNSILRKPCNKHYKCKYLQRGKCRCKEMNIDLICQGLKDKGALQIKDGKYLYNGCS